VAWHVLRRDRWLLTAAPERMNRELVLQGWLGRSEAQAADPRAAGGQRGGGRRYGPPQD
jgi:hypothetical protein